MKISKATGAPSASPNVPDGLPTLSSGSHVPGEGEACVMEYVSILAGEEFSDCPRCTHPVLTEIARTVNDCLPDEERHRLMPLIGRLFGTNNTNTDVHIALMAELDRVLPEMGNASSISSVPCTCMFCRIAGAGGPSDVIEFLSSMIDKYDELTGRTEVAELSAADLRDLAEAVQTSEATGAPSALPNQEVVTA